MPGRILVGLSWLVALLGVGGGVGAWWLVRQTHGHLIPPPAPEGRGSILQYVGSTVSRAPAAEPALVGDFAWDDIATPPKAARAWTRWWWPGGDVEIDIIEAQLAFLDEAGFGGVEIQPFVSGMIGVSEDDTLMERVYAFDSPTYYHTLLAALDAALGLGLQFDLTHFSGWPPGGPEVDLEDSPTLLAHAEADIRGGGVVAQELPLPGPGVSEYIFTPMEFAGVDFINFPGERARLVSAVAGRPVAGKRAWNPFVLDDTVALDADSLEVVTDRIEGGVLRWRAPEGDWKVVASYLLPSGEVPMGAAQRPQGFVIDHLRRAQVIGHYEYAYGRRTGLPRHYGRGLRGFFNDSLEFRARRLSVEGILEEFETRRGYDLEPYLPVIHVEGADNVYFREILGVHAAPEFSITAQDDRIRHDYQQTLSDLIIERFVETSADWAAQRGLVSRGQSYGMDIDLLRALGANTIPETEQLWAGGSDVGIKFASSAAALYGRPLVSAESFVWINRDYMPTARRIKAAADKLFLAGINHIVYHGTPYPWTGGDSGVFGDEGWQPFSGPDNPAHFSANVSPGNTALWPDVPQLNDYIARSQNLLRQGAPVIDLLIYYPFLGFHGPNPTDNRTEALVGGALPDADPPGVPAEAPMLAQGRKLMQRVMTLPHEQRDERVAWVEALQPLLQSLDRSGVTWAWVNGHALQGGTLAGGRLAASGGTYRAVLLPDVDRIERASLDALAELAASGVPVLLSGRQPVEQPGFDPGGKGDAAVRLGVSRLIGAGAKALEPGERALLAALGPQRSSVPGHRSGSAIKRHSRALPDGTRIHFFANQSAAKERVDLAVAPGRTLWWFDALEGRAWPARPGDGGLPLSLQGFESRFLLEGIAMPTAVPPGPSTAAALEGARHQWLLNDWHFVSADYVANWSALIDWRDDEALRHARSGRYTHVLDLDEKREHARYILNLGLVQGSASVSVNGRELGRASIPPFTLDITPALSPGENRIEIEVLAPLRNHFVGRALAGEAQYSHMLVYRDQLVAAGLMGPVSVVEVAEQ